VLRLVDRAGAERIVDGPREPDWAPEYPLVGDLQACTAYASRLHEPGDSDPFGYYQVLDAGVVVGGLGFHGPPNIAGVAEVGYAVVPSVRRRGLASAALVELLGIARRLGVSSVTGRTTEDNVASQRVMLRAGMRPAGRDRHFWHYRIDLA